MTRLSTPWPRAALDLPGAFRLLGRGPSHSELAQVADLLHRSGVEELPYDDELIEIAEANGCGPFTALDLHTTFYLGVEVLTRGPRRRSPMSGSRDQLDLGEESRQQRPEG